MANKKTNKNQRPNLGNLTGGNKAPKFNPYWIYGIAIIVFLAVQYFSFGSGPVQTNWQTVKNTMLKDQDVITSYSIHYTKLYEAPS